MELESVKLYRLPLRSGVAGYRPSTDDDFGRRIMHRLKNVERQEEKESASVEIRLKRHLVIKFEICLKNGIEDNSRAIAIVVWLLQQIQRLSYRPESKESAITTASCIRSLREWVIYCPITRLEAMKREIKRMITSYCSI